MNMFMEKLTRRLVEFNIAKGKISSDDADLYEYGYMLLAEKIMIFIISISIAVFCNAFFEIILLCVSFIPFRIYCGGYHAKSRMSCMILSGISLVAGVYGIRIMKSVMSIELFVIGAMIFGLVIIRYAPVDVEQKKITTSEQFFFRKIVLYVLVVEIVCGIISLLMEEVIYASGIWISMLLCACSIIGELVRRSLAWKL